MNITFDAGENQRLNVRVICIIRKDKKVLLSHFGATKYYLLPGGRIELGEDSKTAIEREILEELGAKITNTKFKGIIENFFEHNDKKYHEYTFIYQAEVTESEEICKTSEMNVKDNDTEIIRWYDVSEIMNMDIRPLVLKDIIINENEDMVHMINIGK